MAYTPKQLMDEAIRLAREGIESGGSPFGAVVAMNGEIVAAARNQALQSNDPTAHAEIVAIREATSKLGRRHLADCVLYSSSEPCPMCLTACYWAQIPEVFYGASITDGAQIGLQDLALYEQLR